MLSKIKLISLAIYTIFCSVHSYTSLFVVWVKKTISVITLARRLAPGMAIVLPMFIAGNVHAQQVHMYRALMPGNSQAKTSSTFFSTVSPTQIGGSRWVSPTLTIRANVTELATSTLNIGVELFSESRFSVSLPVSYNPWTFNSNKKIKHLAFQPEFRLWFGETFRGSFINVQSFVGVQLHYLYYNTGGIAIPFNMFPDSENTRYQGQGAGGGITYANQFGLGGRWRGEIGTTLVFSYLWYDSYECQTCGAFKGSGTRRYLGPGKSSLSIVYLTAIYALY